MVEKMMARSVRLLFTGGLMATLGMAGTAAAQDNTNMQRVEITGSSIKRATAETASPVQVIGREELLRSGKSTVSEYLQTLTVDGAGSLPTGFGNGFAAGSTAISLRGLGATSTLVLLNGRRMAPFARADDGQKSFTDLSTVPMQIVERIEILKDGASSTYGADAIAGVVNIILRKDVQGLEFKADTGWSRYDDGKQNKASVTFGKGDLDEDKYNWVVNAEYMQSDRIKNSDRKDRAYIGNGDLRAYGFPVGTQFAGGYINGTNSVSPSPTGMVRDPVTTNYVNLPGCAGISATTNQTGANGGCLYYVDQWRDMQPEIESLNLYTKGTLQINEATQAYVELGYSKRSTAFMMTPPSVTPTVAFPPNAQTPQGFINYGNANLMSALHPQNPFGANARMRYIATDIGPSERRADNEFRRFVVGVKGSLAGWDYDTGFTYSDSELDLEYTNMLNMNVVTQALSNPASQYFPYYIGDQAHRNPASLYQAMVVNAMSHSKTSLSVIDFKASRELPIALPGGNIGLAIGAEHRREKVSNPSLAGSENGSINSSYVAAFGDAKVSAVYAEILAPILKSLELSAAVRYDKYDNFNSTTPKVGLKWTPIRTFALRGTYTEGFRAPGAAEGSSSSQSTGTSTVRDPIRCPNGPAAGGATQTDCAIPVAAVKVGDPNLQPETSKGVTLGMVWDPFEGTSVALDGWKIKRENEINPLPYNEAAALPTAIRNDNNLVQNGQVIPNSGTLILTQAPYRNSSFTEISGVDLDIKQRLRLGDYGRATLGMVITHVASWKRQESATTVYQFAGTHGNCDTSNCAGTPKNKVNLSATWDIAAFNFNANLNWRDKMQNVLFAGDKCASTLANGQPGTKDCEIASFTTLDLSTRYNVNKNFTLFASVNNVFDRVAPLDPLTYGGISYNPMDASGAIGRYFKIGASYKFF
ncbi:TonB-dependent receptor [Pseudoduganella sp. SL102]|uniref:TonB-dependent receptor n=1 Tax=Pseudoduganella sp. SL102 TaxID=2995154 RepID=UPI00248BAD63|nr:TonB-dependent receptor [Pseudoduganella sp. SL102]WBS04156.1 TonB-dependent receptor [Pseudoduganella sp. SL102]